MAISRRLRYEVLRRDNHTCRYCGANAPDVKLTVDHVTPVALGGSDEPENLVAACQQCNAGKSSANPDAPMVEDVAQDALRWARARETAINEWRDQQAELQAHLDWFSDMWDRWGVDEGENRETVPRDPGWESSVERWLAEGFTIKELTDFIPIAMKKTSVKWHEVWRYYCGIVWRTLDEIQDRTKALAEAGEQADKNAPSDDLPEELRDVLDEIHREGFEEGVLTALRWAIDVGEEARLAGRPVGFGGRACTRCHVRTEFAAIEICLNCWVEGLEANRPTTRAEQEMA